MHGPGGGGVGKEVGVESSRETRPQLHDGHTAHQEGMTAIIMQ